MKQVLLALTIGLLLMSSSCKKESKYAKYLGTYTGEGVKENLTTHKVEYVTRTITLSENVDDNYITIDILPSTHLFVNESDLSFVIEQENKGVGNYLITNGSGNIRSDGKINMIYTWGELDKPYGECCYYFNFPDLQKQ